jgi:glycosyltransferase involved in cell wall biosynthesis
MRILFVITKSDIGGAQVFVLNLAKAFKELGFTVEVVAGDGDFLFEELKKNQINYYYFESLKRDFNLLNALYFVWELRHLIKAKRYNVIHLNSSNTLIGGLASFFLKNKPKSFFTFHGLSFIDRNYNPNRIIKFLASVYYRTMLKSVDKIIFECRLNLEEVQKAGMIGNAPIIYNGIDQESLTFLNREEVRKYFSEKCGIDLRESFLIGSTGRLTYQKNYEFLISIFAKIKLKIPQSKFVIIGEGPDRENYTRLIKKNNLENEIFLVGELKNSHKFMKGFDLFTLSSRYEGVSISLVETLFAEIPMLVTKVGGNVDIVNNDPRQLYELDNTEEYLEKIIYLKDNPTSILENNRKMQSIFTLKHMVQNYKELFESEVN